MNDILMYLSPSLAEGYEESEPMPDLIDTLVCEANKQGQQSWASEMNSDTELGDLLKNAFTSTGLRTTQCSDYAILNVW